MNGQDGQESFELEINSVAFGGSGVGRNCGMVCFVPRTISGERVSVSVAKQHKRFSDCRLLKVLEPSNERIVPACPLWEDGCNGCSYQHMSYPEQLRMRKQQIAELLRHIGSICNVPEIDIVAAQKHVGYRNSLTFNLIRDDEKLTPAFKREDGSFLPVSHCLLGKEDIFKALPEVLSIIEEAYKDKVMPPQCSVTVKQDAAGSIDFALLDSRLRVLMSSGVDLFFEYNGRRLVYSAETFFQTNPEILSKFIDHMRSEISKDCEGEEKETVFFDIYAGVGTVSVNVSDLVDSCVAIESSRESVVCASRNMGAESECKIIEGLAQKQFRSVYKKNKKKRNIVFINPPRAGCRPEMLSALTRESGTIDSLYYLCCEPSILARDLKRLLSGGEFEIESVRAFDMFVWTRHVETLVKLKRKIS